MSAAWPASAVDSAGAASLEAVEVLSAGAVEVAALEVEPPQATSMLAAMQAARIAET